MGVTHLSYKFSISISKEETLMNNEIEIKFNNMICILALRDEDGNRGLYIEDTAGDPYYFIHDNDAQNFREFLEDGFNRAKLAEKLIMYFEET